MSHAEPNAANLSRVIGTDSHFLCAKCGKALYDPQDAPGQPVCLYRLCPEFPDEELEIADYHVPAMVGLRQKINADEAELRQKVLECDPQDLPEYVHRVREALFRAWLANEMIVQPSLWLACGELLLWMNSIHPAGTITDHESFRAILSQVFDWRNEALKLEELENGRYRIMHTGDRPKIFRLSYLRAYHEALETAGLLSDEQHADLESMFPYSEIEEDVFPPVSPDEYLQDWSLWSRQFWNLALQLHLLIKSSLRGTKQYDYAPDLYDKHLVFSRFLQLRREYPEDAPLVPTEVLEKEIAELQSHYDTALVDRGELPGSKNLGDFIQKFTDSAELVPIFTRTPRGILMDWPTCFIFYLFMETLRSSNHESPVPVKRTFVDEAREIAANRFEDYLKEDLRHRGYEVLGPIRLLKKGYEFDLIAWSDTKMRILLIDAKYQDIPGSVANADAVAQTAVFGPQGAVTQAGKQEKRHSQFLKHKRRFEAVADLAHPIEEYEIQSYLVTKHVPVVWKVRGVRIFRAKEFLATQV